MVAFCAEHDLASSCGGPFSMGLLTGKFSPQTRFPDDDVRSDWNFIDGEEGALLHKVDQVRDMRSSDGRTLAQAALAWLWLYSERNVPIPGFKTVQQVQENIGAVSWGMLPEEQM